MSALRHCKQCGKGMPLTAKRCPNCLEPAGGRKPQFVCTNCGYYGAAVREKKGGCLLEIVLWLLFLAPGLIYSIWRRTNRHLICKRCNSRNIVRDDTREGKRLLAELE